MGKTIGCEIRTMVEGKDLVNVAIVRPGLIIKQRTIVRVNGYGELYVQHVDQRGVTLMGGRLDWRGEHYVETFSLEIPHEGITLNQNQLVLDKRLAEISYDGPSPITGELDPYKCHFGGYLQNAMEDARRRRQAQD